MCLPEMLLRHRVHLMSRRLGLLIVSALLSFIGCDRAPLSGSAEREAPPLAASAVFAKEYEGWKTRAVREFPDLGNAGTPMNTRFVERANQLKGQNSRVLQDPKWPYLLAVQVHKELRPVANIFERLRDKISAVLPDSVRRLGNASASAPTVPRGTAGGGPDKAAKPYTVQELKALTVLPGAAAVVGRVTKIDEGGSPGMLFVVLDEVLRCELNMLEAGSAEGLVWQRRGSAISLVRQVGRGAASPIATISIGQLLGVEGVFVQRRGLPVLVGSAKYN